MFKDSFKYYKRKIPPPDLTEVVDFTLDKVYSEATLKSSYPTLSYNDQFLDKFGLKSLDCWKIYELNSHPGFLYIVNPFKSSGQRLWINRALSIYPRPPNKLNLHAQSELKKDEDWWFICQNDPKRKELLHKKLRWVTLGYHHNWDTKVYDESEKSDFPEDLKTLSQIVVKIVCNYDLIPQAAIVNYYNIGSTLSGHTDHSELNQQAPLASFSFGQDAIFLIGGKNIEDSCTAILVRSGDIMVMSKESRLYYHGVPLIRKTMNKPWLSSQTSLESDWEPFEDYITTSRININVRQVMSS